MSEVALKLCNLKDLPWIRPAMLKSYLLGVIGAWRLALKLIYRGLEAEQEGADQNKIKSQEGLQHPSSLTSVHILGLNFRKLRIFDLCLPLL